jgi:chromosome segregation ATPase
MTIAEIILSVATLLFGGGNVLQFFLLREQKRKSSAEAYQTEINSLRTIIAGNVEEIQRLSTNYGELQDRYFALAEELQELKRSMYKFDDK